MLKVNKKVTSFSTGLLTLLLFYASCNTAKAQQIPPFYNEIVQFAHTDSVMGIQKNQILFLGSSTFRKWENMQSYFPEYPLTNRGFGGARLTDVIRYSYDLLERYCPKQVIIYCGENDIAAGVTPQEVLHRVQALLSLVHATVPAAKICYVSIKPSPARLQVQKQVLEANRLIFNYLRESKMAGYIDIYPLMLLKDGSINTRLFISDGIHMNEKGYHLWQPVIESFLL